MNIIEKYRKILEKPMAPPHREYIEELLAHIVKLEGLDGTPMSLMSQEELSDSIRQKVPSLQKPKSKNGYADELQQTAEFYSQGALLARTAQPK